MNEINTNILQGLWKSKAANKPINIHEVADLLDRTTDHKQIVDWLVSEGLTTECKFKKVLHTAQTKAEIGFIADNPIDFVDAYLDHHKVQIRFNGTVEDNADFFWEGANISKALREAEADLKHIQQSPGHRGLKEQQEQINLYTTAMSGKQHSYGLADLATRIKCVAYRHNLCFSDRAIDMQVNEKANQAKSRIVTEVCASVSKASIAKSSVDAMWQRYTELCFDFTRVDQQTTIAVLKQFIYQVKRKMIHKPFAWHLMPIFVGTQASGKSTNTRLLCSPVKQVTRDASFRDIQEGKDHTINDYFVLNMDEMSKLSNEDLETVKTFITAPTVTSRVMHSNNSNVMVQRSTLIGTSNKELQDVVRDSTGNRRFMGLYSRVATIAEIQEIQDFNYQRLWQSVDEFGAEPIADPQTGRMIAGVLAEQAASKSRDAFEDWIAEHSGMMTPAARKELKTGATGRELHALFMSHVDDSRIKYSGFATFDSRWISKVARMVAAGDTVLADVHVEQGKPTKFYLK